MATTLPVTSPTTSATKSSTTEVQPTDEESKIIKEMQDKSIQTNEINILKEHLKSLEDEKKLARIMDKNEVQKTNRLTNKLQKLEKELTLKEPMAQAK